MWIWFGLAALALIGEVSTGTFYLLLVAAGLAAGGFADILHAGLQWQIVACGVVIIVGLGILRATGILKKRGPDSRRSVDVNLDIGQSVSVGEWPESGVTRVRYRGALWEAQLADGSPRIPGPHRIIEMRGAHLILVPIRNETP